MTKRDVTTGGCGKQRYSILPQPLARLTEHVISIQSDKNALILFMEGDTFWFFFKTDWHVH